MKLLHRIVVLTGLVTSTFLHTGCLTTKSCSDGHIGKLQDWGNIKDELEDNPKSTKILKNAKANLFCDIKPSEAILIEFVHILEDNPAIPDKIKLAILNTINTHLDGSYDYGIPLRKLLETTVHQTDQDLDYINEICRVTINFYRQRPSYYDEIWDLCHQYYRHPLPSVRYGFVDIIGSNYTDNRFGNYTDQSADMLVDLLQDRGKSPSVTRLACIYLKEIGTRPEMLVRDDIFLALHAIAILRDEELNLPANFVTDKGRVGSFGKWKANDARGAALLAREAIADKRPDLVKYMIRESTLKVSTPSTTAGSAPDPSSTN